jgi:glycosyltransferase involved in cell wall biosynthesis
VIIPTYNHRDFVIETLESVFAQTFTDYEVIVVNDGSPDDTGEVLRPYIQSGRIRYIEQPNAGQAAARNRGLAEAKGEFIAFLDDDDIWPADKLEWQVRTLRTTSYAAVGGISGLIERGVRMTPTESDEVNEFSVTSLFCGSPFSSPGQILIRRSVLTSIGGFDEDIWGSDDFDLLIRLSMAGSVVEIRKCALYYRRHATNASLAVERMFWNCLIVIKKNLPALSVGLRPTARRSAYRWLYRYAGRKVFESSLHGPGRNIKTAFRVAGAMFGAAILDVRLAYALAITLTPPRVRKGIRSVLLRLASGLND